MNKRKVFIAIHQLNIGGAQKALLEALNAIDYSENEVTLYVRKDRLELLPQVNPSVSSIIVNRDHTRYYRKPYAVWLHVLSKLRSVFGRDTRSIEEKLRQYVINKQRQYEYKHFLSKLPAYDVAVSYIQGYTAKAVADLVNAKKRVMFYHDSTDSLHELHCLIMKEYDRIYCVSQNAMKAVQSFYPQFAEKMQCMENHVNAQTIRNLADALSPVFPKNILILCTCGRIAAVKGYDLAAEAAAILNRQGVDFKWYFIGDGADRPKIESLIAEKGLADCIELTGMLENPYPYIKGCDIYVQPSYEEAHSLSIQEAQILCRPVVTTATAGGKAMIKDGVNGLLAEISAAAIAEKIALLCKNPDLLAQIKQEVANIDWAEDEKRFRAAWKKLLEEE